ncbi:MAG: hypothetical protein V5A55_07760 [Halovenus sp.]
MSSGGAPSLSEDEFNDELKSLLLRAIDSGLDVEGGWECLNGASYPDYDVVVTEIQKKGQAEEPRSANT